MSNDALERLKQRQRPTVPTRDATLAPSSVDTSISSNLELKKARTEDILVARQLEGKQPEHPVELVTKQSTLRLEAQLIDRLSAVCRDNGISREVFIEALFKHYEEADPETRQAILIEAKRRGEQRQQVANFRRAQSMMQKFGDQNLKE